MSDVDAAYRRLVEVARGRDINAGICQTFLFSIYEPDVYGGWSPRTLRFGNPQVRKDMFIIMQHLCEHSWAPDPRHIKHFWKNPVTYWQ